MSWLKHAFAVDPEGPTEPKADEVDVVERICREIVRRHLTTPSLIFLEMSRPMNYLQSQALQFVSPGVEAILRRESYESYTAFCRFLERRGSIDHLRSRLEELEDERDRKLAESQVKRV